MLIVCEGSKTECQYFDEIRKINRIPTAHIKIIHGGVTQPMQIVEFAKAEFEKQRAFDSVYAVFDRDAHLTYNDALIKAASFNNRLINDEAKKIDFFAVPSVPCFELWLLLHFENTQAFFDRHEPIQKLKNYITGYDKGMKGIYATTQDSLPTANLRAQGLRSRFTAEAGIDAFTDVDLLVEKLKSIVLTSNR